MLSETLINGFKSSAIAVFTDIGSKKEILQEYPPAKFTKPLLLMSLERQVAVETACCHIAFSLIPEPVPWVAVAVDVMLLQVTPVPFHHSLF